ncbi:MAG TPA: hypothetical protein VK811_10670 [Candidatus Acidoferrum sp.]|jgi:hypothetical protein|nr:hypothetical protein [Candidatus Acidoferrum sp.]
MIRWFFKWVLRLCILVAVFVVIFLLSLNSILRVVIEHNLRAQTGMEAEIGRFKLGLTEPTLEIQDLKIYNPAGFGGTPFLDIAEIHAEYDRAALARKEIHLTLLRFNLAELDIVKSQSGQTNIFSLAKMPQTKSGAPASRNFKKQTGYDFQGIDTLNVSFGKAKYIDLQDPGKDREQTIGLSNCVVPDVKSMNDLAGLVLLVGLRSNHFFDPLIAKPKNPAAVQSILDIMGVSL